jgi:hypothetical protein
MAEKLTPKDRADWLTLRQKDVTSSEIGCLVDPEHPWITPLQLWNIKTGRLVPDHIDSPVLRRGKKLELVGAEETAERMPGARIEHNTSNTYWRDGTLRIGATPDLLVDDPERGLGVVELKNPGVGTYARKWENGEPPLFMALQVLTAAKLTGSGWAAIGALRVNDFTYDFDLVPIPLHQGAWQALLDAVGAFWRNVETDTPPEPNYKRDLGVLAEMYPQSAGTSIDLSGDNELIHALAEREEAKVLAKDLDAQIEQLDAMIRHKLGEHETAVAQDWRVTLKTEHVSAYTVAARTRRPIRVKRLKGNAA